MTSVPAHFIETPVLWDGTILHAHIMHALSDEIYSLSNQGVGRLTILRTPRAAFSQ
jgi:hypothetical protein